MLIIDRFEGEQAVVEFGKITFEIPRAALPKNTKEGDVILISIDHDRTQSRKERIDQLSDELFT